MYRTLILTLALALSAPAFAQSHADAMARLAPFAGSYTLDGTAEIEEGSFDGSLTISPILGGHFQQWDWEMDMEGPGVEEKVYLRFVVAYDAGNNAYVIHRFDSRDVDSPTRASGDGIPPALGGLGFDGDALVMSWPMTNPDDASKSGRFRNIVRLTPQGLDVETEVKPDGGGATVAIATTRAARR